MPVIVAFDKIYAEAVKLLLDLFIVLYSLALVSGPRENARVFQTEILPFGYVQILLC